MPNTISFNPALTTSPYPNFLASTRGAVQGTFDDDPSSRMWLMQGQVVSGATLPLYGGLPITELTPAATGSDLLGPIVQLATANANVTGFTVFNQGHNMLMTPSNLVPQSSGGMSVMFFRMGSGARIWVGVDSGVAGAVDGNAINTTVYWDYTNNVLNNTGTGALAVKVLKLNTTCKTITVTSNLANWATGTCALIQI